jgi:regulator of sirC expression with transglutaminase-like and TPR domain
MIEPYASQIIQKLTDVGLLPDDGIDLFDAALLISALDHPGRSIERYTLHKQRMVDACTKTYNDQGALSAWAQLDALREIIFTQEEYAGDQENYDRLDNADLMSVVDRRRGLPITLAIIYMSVARDAGWLVEALSFPAHVFLRIEHAGERIIFDPFDGAKVMEAHSLREKLKELVGGQAELSADYYDAMTPRDILARLQNNIKTRLISGEDFEGALQRIDVMRLILPDDPRLVFEAGVMHARVGQRRRAVTLLSSYVDMAVSQDERESALLLLEELERGIH